MGLKLKKVEVVEPFKHLQVLYEETATLADGGEIVTGNFRKAFTPGSDVSEEPDEVKQLAGFLWTPEVIAAFQAAQAEAGN